MLHPDEGTPFAPLECPVEQEGEIRDLRAARFELVYEHDEDGIGVWGVFKVCDKQGELTDVVQTDDITLEPDSLLDQKLRRLIHNHDGLVHWIADADNPFARRIGSALCDNVAHCWKTKTLEGKCRALGSEALMQVIIRSLEDEEL